MKFILLSLILSFPIFAKQAHKVMVCPALTKNGATLVSNLRSLQEEIRKAPECESLQSKIKNINDLINNEKWDSYKKAMLGNEVEDLEGQDIETMGGLVRDFTSNLMESISFLSGAGNNCIAPESKAGFLSTLASVTNEVATVVGNTTGPYGMAVSLGGNLISEVINGIDVFFKSNDIYDFENKDEELLFMNQFCAFTEAQKDVADIIGMDFRISEMTDLNKYLNVKINDLIKNCPECKAYKLAYDYKFESDKIVKRIMEDAGIVNNPESHSQAITYSKCTEIGRAFHTPNSDLSQLFDLFKKYEALDNPLMTPSDRGLLQQVIEGKKYLDSRYPTIGQCWAMSRQQEIEISKEFNDRLRDDILPLNETIFGQQKTTFVYLANKKYKNPLGDYISLSLDRRFWVTQQIKEVEANLRNPNRGVDLEHVRQLNEKLQNRIVGKLMPRYMVFLIDRNLSYIKAFEKELKVFLNNQFVKYNRIYKKYYPNLSELLKDVKSGQKVDPREFMSEWRAIVDKFNIAHDQRSNIGRYCSYLKYGLNAINGISSICNNNVKLIDQAIKNLSYQSDNLKQLHAFDVWANKNLNITGSRVRDYSNHIRDWTERGDERWQIATAIETQSSILKIEEERMQWERDVISQDLFREM